MKIGPVVPEICSQTDRHTDGLTDRQVHRNTPLPYGGGVLIRQFIRHHNMVSLQQYLLYVVNSKHSVVCGDCLLSPNVSVFKCCQILLCQAHVV